MNERTFDPNAWLDNYRESFASVQKAQEQTLKTFERFARFQYAIAGDYMDAGIAQAQAALSVKNPAELLAKQTELGARLNEKLRTRAQELANITTEAQTSVASFATETANRASASAKKVA